MKKISALFPILLFLFSCGSYRQNTALRQSNTDPELITQSLFDSEDRTLSEEDIQRLLDGEIKIPDTMRVALFNFSNNSVNRYYSYHWQNEEYLKIQQGSLDTLISKIEASTRVEHVLPIPSIMANHKSNVVQMREAAVRLQADVLLIFSIQSDIYYKYKAFKKDEAKAFATCEVVLMDIRTGMIPFSQVVTKEKFTRKGSSDLTAEELRRRAEQEAVLMTLAEVGEKVSNFINQLDR